MEPIGFTEANCTPGPPRGMTEEQVQSIMAWAGRMEFDGLPEAAPCVVTCWRPSAHELEVINKTGVVWSVVMGQGLPPQVLMGFRPPFPKGE